MVKKTNEDPNEFTESLKAFFKANRYSDITKTRGGYFITNPWNDKSVRFTLEKEPKEELIKALNCLILPPRFTGMYHIDTNTMEFIYTVLEEDEPSFSRKFNFTLGSKNYNCEFAESSQRLLTLSRCFIRARTATNAEFRNLQIYKDYIQIKDDEEDEEILKEIFHGAKPVSFYIRGFSKYDENLILELSEHLNFFMNYYDRDSPLILIHTPEDEKLKSARRLQLLESTFPQHITTKKHDSFFLNLLYAALQVEVRLQYIYYYQVLEYAAFYYIDSNIKSSLLRIINTPDIQSEPEKYISEMLDKITELNQGDEAKMDRIVQTRCNPEVLWKEIEHNKEFFLKEQKFDGGYVLDPCISGDMTYQGFSVAWHPKLIKCLRGVRNALVHGRERRVADIISPTKQNDLKLRSLTPIIRRMAEQVIIYDSLP